MPRRVMQTGWGPLQLLDTVKSTGPGVPVDCDPSRAAWGFQVNLNSSVAVTANVVLEGTLDMVSTAPTYGNLITWSTTRTTGDLAFQADRPVGKVRVRLVSINSTSTAATLDAFAGSA